MELDESEALRLVNLTYVSPRWLDAVAIVTDKTGINDAGSEKTGARHLLEPEGCVVLHFADYVPWNNPEMVISQEVEEFFQTAVFCALLPVSFLISTPTNIISMFVFYKHGLKERINMCVFYLSLVDLLYVLLAFLFQGDTLYLKIEHLSRYSLIRGFFLINKLAGVMGFYWVSALVSMVIACERCFCVLKPLVAHAVLQTRVTVWGLTLTSLAVLTGYFFVGARWTVTCVFDTSSNVTTLTSYPSSFYLSHRKTIDTLDGVVYGLVLPNLCVGVVTLCTAATVVRLRVLAAWRMQTSSADTVSSRDVALTRMLVGTSLLFLACSVPGVSMRTAMLFVPDLSVDGRYRNLFYLMFFMHQEASFIGCSFNFFVYYKYGTRFRETVNKMGLEFSRRFQCYNRKPVSKVLNNHGILKRQDCTTSHHGE